MLKSWCLFLFEAAASVGYAFLLVEIDFKNKRKTTFTDIFRENVMDFIQNMH